MLEEPCYQRLVFHERREGGLPAHDGAVDVPAALDQQLKHGQAFSFDGRHCDGRGDGCAAGEEEAGDGQLFVDDGGEETVVEVVLGVGVMVVAGCEDSHGVDVAVQAGLREGVERGCACGFDGGVCPGGVMWGYWAAWLHI